MKYSVCIDQVRAIEWGLNLSEAYAFAFCYSLPSWADTIIIGTDIWYFGSRNKALDEIPLLTDKPDTVYRHYRALAAKGIIEWKKFDGKDCIRITEKGKQWNTSEINPQFGKFSESPRKIFRITSEINPTDKITIDKITIDKSANAPRSKFQKPEVEEIQTYLEELFLKTDWRPRFRENPQDMAGHLFDYYESNGWKVGRNSMKDWQAACRTWLKKNESYKPIRNGNGKQQPARPANGKLVSEETQRRVYAELLHEFGDTGGQV